MLSLISPASDTNTIPSHVMLLSQQSPIPFLMQKPSQAKTPGAPLARGWRRPTWLLLFPQQKTDPASDAKITQKTHQLLCSSVRLRPKKHPEVTRCFTSSIRLNMMQKPFQDTKCCISSPASDTKNHTQTHQMLYLTVRL